MELRDKICYALIIVSTVILLGDLFWLRHLSHLKSPVIEVRTE